MLMATSSMLTVPYLWPDDYLYFGQMLTYGYDSSIPHEDLPSHIAKNNGRLTQTAFSNRVYRAPAYFRSEDMDVAHYNMKAYLAAYSAPKTVTDTDLNPAYPGMTAIDFAGHGDQNYILGLSGNKFYPPLLDDDGLIGVANKGETPNLLVYAPSSTANEMTYDVLNGYFIGTSDARYEPMYSDYTESRYEDYNDGNNYGRIAVASTSTINGHLVQSNLQTTTDHLLVDKRDFNCPIPYQMGSDYRMWYQRKPDNYVGVKNADGTYTDSHSGWNDISLPFKAEIVTTNVKGEITHFYSGSKESANETHSKVGHEYWLRELKEGGHISASDDNVYEAILGYPAAKSADGKKDYTNMFLWDYYYSWNSRDDLNKDDYQIYYQADEHGIVNTFEGYPRLAAATPYIIGFPGERYYEFDLSGKFKAETTLTPNPTQLGQQTITFASAPGATIGVSDEETKDGKSDGNYTFKPNYLNQTLTSVAADDNTSPRDFVLNTAGNAYEANLHAAGAASKTVALSAFRPYFTTATAHTRSIIFGNEQLEELKGVEEHGDPRKEEINGGLRIWTKKDKIFVESTLSFKEDVRVVTPAGITVAAFDVEPGQTVEVQADFSGLYIVHTLDGKYTKKVSVKK